MTDKMKVVEGSLLYVANHSKCGKIAMIPIAEIEVGVNRDEMVGKAAQIWADQKPLTAEKEGQWLVAFPDYHGSEKDE